MEELNQEKKELKKEFEYPFDFNRYIEERLREIGDLEERRYAKVVLKDGLGKIIRCTEEKYKALERRIYDEIEIPGNCYEIVSTIVRKEHYDPTNDTLFPVCREDLDKDNQGEPVINGPGDYLETLYLELSEQELEKMSRELQHINVKLCREDSDKAGEAGDDPVIVLRPALRYREIVEQLYLVFQNNSIPWNTINTAHLDKFYDVFLSWQSNRPSTAIKKQDVEYSLGKWDAAVRRGVIPLWNVQKILFKSASFMTPCPDGIHYEHQFMPEYETQEDGYVIQANEDILEIRHEKGKIILRSRLGTFDGWIAYRIVQKGPVRSLDYTAPVLTNRKKDSFLRRYAENTQIRLLTKADLFRRITELDIGDYLEIFDYQICDNVSDFPLAEGMNWFIRDELFPMDRRKILLFLFREKRQGYYLNDAMVRFVISQIQLEIGEYRCVGEISK